MNEKTYVLTEDAVLETLRVVAVPDGLAKPVRTLVYDPATGRFVWVWKIPPHMDEVTAELLETLPDDALVGLDPAVESWIAELTSPRETILAAARLVRIATELPPDRLVETRRILLDAGLRLFDAGVVRGLYERSPR